MFMRTAAAAALSIVLLTAASPSLAIPSTVLPAQGHTATIFGSLSVDSLAFGPAERGSLPEYQQVGDGYGTVSTLAAAVVRAVDLGATVINISQVACARSPESLDDDLLGRSLRFAHDRGVGVVAAAGNLQGNGPCGTQNPIADPALPDGPA